MSAPRPTARTIILVVLVSALLAAPAGARAPASATAAEAPPPQIVFPVIGTVSYSDDFGDPRAQGGHPGNDILADRRAPVVAAEAGRIVFWTRSATAGCMLYLYGRSGTTYQYIHLNNDLTNRNDNRGSCVPGIAFAPGLRDGQNVAAGELIGYVGDSGDADGIHPHLHFEIHPGGGKPVSPFPWLEAAEHLSRVGGAPTETAPTAVETPVNDQVLARGASTLVVEPVANEQVLARGVAVAAAATR
jgi:murein DD-endopeptidase MepM/ murein hydrolase activator NlpD